MQNLLKDLYINPGCPDFIVFFRARTVEKFNPATGEFEAGYPLPIPFAVGSCAAATRNGTILYLTRDKRSGGDNKFYEFHPSGPMEGQFVDLPDMPGKARDMACGISGIMWDFDINEPTGEAFLALGGLE